MYVYVTYVYQYFQFSGKILIVGGLSRPDRNPPMEIIELIDKESKPIIVKDENGSRIAATGGILQNQLLICGGCDFDNHKYCKNTSKNVSIIAMPKCFEMKMPRRNMSSVVLSDSKIWVTGGVNDIAISPGTMSTEIISLDQPPVPGPDLPFFVGDHSMEIVDPKTIYLIGGMQNGQTSNKTWIIDPTNNFQIKVGPSLNMARDSHSCSKMKIEGRIFLVVAGGQDDSGPLDSVELLDITYPDQGWKFGIKYRPNTCS